MVFLIAGASHTGKTALAQRLLEKYGYPYLSIDHLKMGLIRSGYTSLTPMSSDRELTDYLWPVVREMIKTAVENGQNLIVEGCYLPFNWREDFPLPYLAHIRALWLVFSGEYIQNHYRDILAHADDIEHRLEGGPALETLLLDNEALLAGCRACGCPCLLIDRHYPTSVNELEELLC